MGSPNPKEFVFWVLSRYESSPRPGEVLRGLVSHTYKWDAVGC